MAIEAHTDVHPRRRETGRCGTCGELWPCAATRAELLAQLERREADRASLGMWLSKAMLDQQTVEDADQADDLRRRYLGWLPRRPATDRMSASRTGRSGTTR